jgi:hypothetical protein
MKSWSPTTDGPEAVCSESGNTRSELPSAASKAWNSVGVSTPRFAVPTKTTPPAVLTEPQVAPMSSEATQAFAPVVASKAWVCTMSAGVPSPNAFSDVNTRPPARAGAPLKRPKPANAPFARVTSAPTAVQRSAPVTASRA